VLDAKCLVARAQNCRLFQFADSFDHYNTATEMYETVSGTVTYGSAYRRFGPPAGLPGQGIYLVGAYVRKNMLSNQATLIAKVACQPQTASASPGAAILSFLDNGSANQVAIVLTPAGAIAVYSGWQHVGGNILVGSTGSGAIAPGQYVSVEAEVTINASAGAVTVWVNGIQVLAITGANTQFTSDAYANQVQLGDGLLSWYMDDFRVWDNTGSTQNAAAGASNQDSRLVTKMPSGAGIDTEWTPNGAAANWQCVDDNPPDGDTTYVSAAYSGSGPDPIDAYTMPSAGFTAAPLMVVSRSYVRKDDGATRTIEIGVAQSGGSAGVAGSFTVGSTYAFITACIPEDPATTAPWTAAGADSAQHYKQETA
jgi:hypothetical protein